LKYRWNIIPPNPLLAESLAGALKISPLLGQCLVNRGFGDQDVAGRFLVPRLKTLADPFLLPNMGIAVDRLLLARENQEPLVIFGDYDVDGVTSTALLFEFLSSLGWRVNYYLPHRLDEGYGLSRDGVENCLKKHPYSLLLAVDCGSTTVDTIAWLRERGTDVVVLDHHQVSDPAPNATALVNPQLLLLAHPAGETNFTELCSAGLAFKLVHAIVKRARERGVKDFDAVDLKPYLDLVALGTVADLVPLTGENRILVTAGLERLTNTQRPGLQALKQVAQVGPSVGVYEVGFQLGPRLNAAGRLETATDALNLLLAKRLDQAEPIANNLDACNRERQQIERQIAKEVTDSLRPRFSAATDFVIVEGNPAWHIGVVGIVASRVLQEFYRPTIILGGDGDHWRGSGRSIEVFDLALALRSCDDLLIRHGGHAMAAGVTVRPDKVDELRQRLNAIAQRTLTPEQLQPVLRLDAEIPLGKLTAECLTEIDKLRPFGQQNPTVHLYSTKLTNARAGIRMGADKQHVKLWVTDGKSTIEAVWWGAGNANWPTGVFDLAYVPQINEYNGKRTLQLKVLDWRPVVS
jgi:single-stranded-DNA-specific exonuclease